MPKPPKELSPLSQLNVLAKLPPEERASLPETSTLLEKSFEYPNTRTRTHALKIMGETLQYAPGLFTLIERGVTDPNDHVSAAAIRALSGAATIAPNRAVELVEYAWTRKPFVHDAIGEVAVGFASAKPDTALTIFQRYKKERPERQYRQHMKTILTGSTELFSLWDNTPRTQANTLSNSWRGFLEDSLRAGEDIEHTVIELEAQRPGIGINLLLLASKANRLNPNLTEVSDGWLTSFLRKSLIWEQKEPKINARFQQIQAHPEGSGHLYDEMENIERTIMHSSDSAGGLRTWHRLDDFLPGMDLKNRVTPFYRRRRVDENSFEYQTTRKQHFSVGSDPEIFGYEEVKAASIGERAPAGSTIAQFKNKVDAIDTTSFPAVLSQANKTKLETLSRILDLDMPEAMKARQLEMFVATYVADNIEAAQKTMEYVPQWEAEFLEKLPHYVDRELAHQRIKETRIILIDEFSRLSGDSALNAVGTFHVDDSSVRINITKRLLVQHKIYIHEMLHALSGRSLIYTPPTATAKPSIVNQRVGLIFSPAQTRAEHFKSSKYARNHVPKGRFYWLNEGVTEDLTQEMMAGASPYETYTEEQQLIKALQTKGTIEIPDEIIRRAYFENRTIEKGVPAWHEFLAYIRQSYGKVILNEIDDIVGTRTEDVELRKERIAKAIALVEDLGSEAKKRQNPHYRPITLTL